MTVEHILRSREDHGFGHAPIGQAEIEHAVESLMRGIATDYPALLEHSRLLTNDPHAVG
jgi:hypothetical protein